MAPAYSLKKSLLPPADAAVCAKSKNTARSLPPQLQLAAARALEDLDIDNPRDELTLAQR
jgi:hypothetical protein